MKSKTSLVLDHLIKYGEINRKEGVDLYSTMDLPKIINKLRQSGYRIKTEKADFIEGACKYILITEQKPEILDTKKTTLTLDNKELLLLGHDKAAVWYLEKPVLQDNKWIFGKIQIHNNTEVTNTSVKQINTLNKFNSTFTETVLSQDKVKTFIKLINAYDVYSSVLKFEKSNKNFIASLVINGTQQHNTVTNIERDVIPTILMRINALFK